MNLGQARFLATSLALRHGLWGWRSNYADLGDWLACCDELSKTIFLNPSYVELAGWDHVRDTVLHEIAHARVGCGHRHDEVWQQECRRIGARPEPQSTFTKHLSRPSPTFGHSYEGPFEKRQQPVVQSDSSFSLHTSSFSLHTYSGSLCTLRG
jgi:hypothetical protein